MLCKIAAFALWSACTTAFAALTAPAVLQQVKTQANFCTDYPQECRPAFGPPRVIIHNTP